MVSCAQPWAEGLPCPARRRERVTEATSLGREQRVTHSAVEECTLPPLGSEVSPPGLKRGLC